MNSKAKKRIEAIRALRLNYRWRGVWAWLKGRQRCRHCTDGKVRPHAEDPTTATVSYHCIRCSGKPKRGYQRILSEPERVIQEQHALAEGAFV